MVPGSVIVIPCCKGDVVDWKVIFVVGPAGFVISIAALSDRNSIVALDVKVVFWRVVD